MSVTGLTLVDVQWSVSRKVVDLIPGNPKLMTHEPHEAIGFFMHKQSHMDAHRNPIRNWCEHATESTKC